MIRIDGDSVVVSFPEVHAAAVVRVSFRRAEPPYEAVGLSGGASGVLVAGGGGRVVLHFRPRMLGGYWKDRYPFAVLAWVGGVNAVTGEIEDVGAGLRRRPQNYFVSPPQGAVDGYVVGGEWRAFVAWGEVEEDRTPLDLVVVPMKGEAMEHLEGKRRLVPGPEGWVSRFVLPGTEGRRPEPIYEDVCSLGDWDQGRGARVRVWVRGGR